MGKWIAIIVLFLFAVGACAVFGAVSTAPSDFAAEMGDVAKYQIAMEATVAAATPDSVELLNANREGLYEYNVESKSGGGLVVLAIVLWLLVFLLVGVMLMQNSAEPIKQVRLLQKQWGGRTNRRLPTGRAGTLPQIPYLNQPGSYRQIPEQAQAQAAPDQYAQEVDWYDDDEA